MPAEDRLRQLKITLPTPPKAMAAYSSWVRSGNLLFIAGQGPVLDGKPTVKGKVGAGVTPQQAYDAARLSCLNALAVARDALGSLDKVKRPVYARLFVACADDFTEQPKVANGATELLRDLFGEANLPARAAVGTNVLPLDIPVELELVFEVQ
jgi:enamine deaminase RidA (YjgF/YER057c/UK114 family)